MQSEGHRPEGHSTIGVIRVDISVNVARTRVDDGIRSPLTGGDIFGGGWLVWSGCAARVPTVGQDLIIGNTPKCVQLGQWNAELLTSECWRPRRDSNPRYRRERAMS